MTIVAKLNINILFYGVKIYTLNVIINVPLTN